MTTYQTASRILVALKRESTTGVAATAGGATQLRITDSPGLKLNRAVVRSVEKRADGIQAQGRLGFKSVDGSYNGELSVGGATDILLEAIMRSTWVAAVVRTYDNSAGLTSLGITGTAEITQVGTTTLIGVVFVGDTITLGGMSNPLNNDLRLRVTAVSATVVTVAGTPLTVQGADTACTLTVLKKLKTATTPTRYSHTVEQYDTDVDLSELFLGCRVVGVRFSFKPGAMATVTYTFLGMDRTALLVGTSPWFTTPTLSTTMGLVADDSSIRMNGAEVSKFTGFDLEFQITAAGQPVIGQLVSPDVFDNDQAVTGSITGLRSDFANLTLYDAETEFELSILLQEPTGTPKQCLSIFLPRVKIQSLEAPVGGGDGAKIETVGLMIGPKAAATGYDATIATFCSSGA
jgi:hypothetical protein